jgi:hypothetical protein
MCRRWISIVVLLIVVPSSWCFEAQRYRTHKMWYMGHVISVGDGEFAFRTRWHPSRTVHVTDTTAITCAKQKISLAAVRVENLVEINALADDRDIWGTKVKVHASLKDCEGRQSFESTNQIITETLAEHE